MPFDIPENCALISAFPITNANYSDWFFSASRLVVKPSHSGLVQSLYSMVSSFSAKDVQTHAFRPINSFMENDFNRNFILLSVANYATYLAVNSLAYRAYQLIGGALHHKIETSDLPPAIKVCASIAIEFFVMRASNILGYPTTDLFYTQLVKILLQVCLSKKYANKVRESTLICSTRNFTWKNFLSQNLLTGVINLSATFSLDFYQMCISLNQAMFATEPIRFYECQGEKPFSFAIGVTPLPENYLIAETGRMNTPLQYFVYEIVWMLAKMAMDLLVVLLAYDVRNPLPSVLSQIKKIPSIFQPARVDKQVDNRAILKKQGQKKAAVTQAMDQESTIMELQASMVQTIPRNRLQKKTAVTQAMDQESTIMELQASMVQTIPRNRLQKKTALAIAEASPSNVIDDDKAKEVNRKVTPLPGYKRVLVPLAHEIQGLSRNTWAVITCGDLLHEEPKLIPHFQRLVSSAHVKPAGSKGSITQLRATEDAGMLYELRPDTDSRILGVVRKGQKAAIEALKDKFNVHSVIDATSQWIEEDIDLIEFYLYVPKHNKINAAIGKAKK